MNIAISTRPRYPEKCIPVSRDRQPNVHSESGGPENRRWIILFVPRWGVFLPNRLGIAPGRESDQRFRPSGGQSSTGNGAGESGGPVPAAWATRLHPLWVMARLSPVNMTRFLLPSRCSMAPSSRRRLFVNGCQGSMSPPRSSNLAACGRTVTR